MPEFRPSRRTRSLVAAVCGTMLATLGLAGVTPALAAATTGGNSPFGNCGKINVNAKKGGAQFAKGTSGTTSLTDVTITAEGCDMEIKANRIETTSLDLDDSDWTLNGNVRIRSDQQQSKLSSDRAVVQFRNSEIQRITMTGNPAEFEQKRPDSGIITRGHAKQMVYEAGAGTVRLVEDAWISDGTKDIKTPQLVYDIRKAEIRSTGSDDNSKSSGSSGGVTGDRVIITIDPNASKGAKKKDESQPTPTPPKP
jgi:lipopolysaccharide transport protein LptA